VEARLRRTLVDPGEVTQLPGEVDEASVLVEGYLRVEYDAELNPAPSAVIVVTSRVVARMVADTGVVPANADSLTRGMGPFSATTHLVADSTSGGPWLTKSDKVALEPFRVGGVACIPLSREGYIPEGS
jgi:hypothetical protein